MPLTTPPIGAAPLYARNKLTGQTFLVGPTTKMIDDLGDVDTSTTGPTGGQALIWDATLGQWVPGDASTVAAIDDLTDVDTTTTPPTDGQGLVWDDAAQQWVPGTGVGYIDDLLDVDTVTGPPQDGMMLQWAAAPTGSTGPTGQWVPGPGGAPISVDVDNEIILGTDGGIYSNEVHLGPTGPTLDGPDLWADPAAGLLYAAATGPTGAVEWVPVGADSTEVGDVEPTSDIWELWVDTSTQSPLPGGPVGLALDDLTDVVSSAPVDGNGLGWDSAASNWVPQGMWKSWSGTQAEFDAIPTKDPNTLYAVI